MLLIVFVFVKFQLMCFSTHIFFQVFERFHQAVFVCCELNGGYRSWVSSFPFQDACSLGLALDGEGEGGGQG